MVGGQALQQLQQRGKKFRKVCFGNGFGKLIDQPRPAGSVAVKLRQCKGCIRHQPGFGAAFGGRLLWRGVHPVLQILPQGGQQRQPVGKGKGGLRKNGEGGLAHRPQPGQQLRVQFGVGVRGFRRFAAEQPGWGGEEDQPGGFLTAQAQAAFLFRAEPVVKARVLVADGAEVAFAQLAVDVAQVLFVQKGAAADFGQGEKGRVAGLDGRPQPVAKGAGLGLVIRQRGRVDADLPADAAVVGAAGGDAPEPVVIVGYGEPHGVLTPFQRCSAGPGIPRRTVRICARPRRAPPAAAPGSWADGRTWPAGWHR